MTQQKKITSSDEIMMEMTKALRKSFRNLYAAEAYKILYGGVEIDEDCFFDEDEDDFVE